MTDAQRQGARVALEGLEKVAGVLVPPPWNLLVVAALHEIEDRVLGGDEPSQDELEAMRAAAEARVQARLDAKF